jgi:hypothetical protein
MGDPKEDPISVTERASSTVHNAPTDATVHTRDGGPELAPPPNPGDRSRGPVSGNVLPGLRKAIRPPEEPPEGEVSRFRWLAPLAVLLGPPGVGLAMFLLVLIGLPTIAFCLSGDPAPPEETPGMVDGVPVRKGFKNR